MLDLQDQLRFDPSLRLSGIAGPDPEVTAMNLPEYVTYIIALAVCAGVAWVCYPHLLLVLGINQYRNGVFGGPEDLEPDDKSVRYQDVYYQLVHLGFEPLGLHWSTIGRTISTQTFVFSLPEVHCIATIYSRSDNLYLVTGFEGNAALETTSVRTNEIRSNDFWLTSIPDASVKVLLSGHQNQLQELVSKGWQPLPASKLEDIPAITRAASSGSDHNSRLRSAALKILGTFLLIIALPWLGLAAFVGYFHPLPWLLAGLTSLSIYALIQRSSTRVRLDKSTIQSSQPQSVDNFSE
jgi:hypothetical protein